MKKNRRDMLLADLDALHLTEETLGLNTLLVSESNPLKKKAVFKCKDVTISEVFGYLLAQTLRVPVADFLGLWFDKDVETPDGYSALANHFAVLTEFLFNLSRISLEDLSSRDKPLVARILTLCLFDRHEWPEAFSSGSSVVVIDLERIGPIMKIDELTVGSPEIIRKELLYRQDEYVNTSYGALREVVSRAEELQVLSEFQWEFSKACQISPECLCHNLSVEGHPYSHRLSAFFQSAINKRQTICASALGLRPWPEVDWESLIT